MLTYLNKNIILNFDIIFKNYIPIILFKELKSLTYI